MGSYTPRVCLTSFVGRKPKNSWEWLALVLGGFLRQECARWMDLCELAADEQNPKKLLALITQINALLAAKQERLKGKVSDPRPPAEAD